MKSAASSRFAAIASAPPAASRDESPTIYARVFAATVAVEGLPAALARRMALLLKPFLVPADEQAVTHHTRIVYDVGARCWYLYNGATCLSYAETDDELLGLTEWFVVHCGVAACADTVLIHGAALHRAGATLVLVGDSGAGKTTLTLGLLARGWLPYGDDVTPVDPITLQVRAFPRYFHVDAATLDMFAGVRVLRRPRVPAGHAAPRLWASVPAQPTTVVVMGRDPQQPAAIAPITRAEAAGALLHAAMETAMPRGDVAHIAARIAATVTECYRLNNGELQATLDLLETAAESR